MSYVLLTYLYYYYSVTFVTVYIDYTNVHTFIWGGGGGGDLCYLVEQEPLT